MVISPFQTKMVLAGINRSFTVLPETILLKFDAGKRGMRRTCLVPQSEYPELLQVIYRFFQLDKKEWLKYFLIGFV